MAGVKIKTKGRFRQHHHGKGKRWKKGFSSSSNPETKKFRNAAKRGFFQQSVQSNLTQELLARHDASQLEQEVNRTVTNSDCQSFDTQTHGSFLSSLTNCSNPTFDKVHQHTAINSELQKETLAILAAVTDVIKTGGGKESETEYFAALMTTLETIEGSLPTIACSYLLSLCIKRVPRSVLQTKFSEVTKVLLTKLSQCVESEQGTVFKWVISCLTTMLRAQEIAVWKEPSTEHMFHIILNFCIHSKPKIRKMAQGGVCSILKGSVIMLQDNAPSFHPAATLAAKFCVSQIEQCGALGKATATLHILGLLRYVLAVLPSQQLKKSCETILKIMTLGNVLIVSVAMQALHGMFAARPKESNLPKEMNAQIINALFDYQPGNQDSQAILAWLTVMKEAFLNLTRLDEHLCLQHLPRFFQVAVQMLSSQNPSVVDLAESTLITLLQDCVGSQIEILDFGNSSVLVALEKMFENMEGGLSYQYHATWDKVLQIITTFFKVAGKQGHSFMQKCLLSIADLRDSVHFQNKSEADSAIGAAVQAMGPEIVLRTIPLNLDPKSEELDFPRSWLLPLLRANIQNSRLGYFIEYFLPLAAKFRIAGIHAQEEKQSTRAKIFDIVQSQIWSLLYGFCTRPVDLIPSFKNIAKILGTGLMERPDLRTDILAALRHLISQNLEHEENKMELTRFAKNYLPIFFNLFTIEPEEMNSKKVTADISQLQVFETVKLYLKITDKPLINEFVNMAIVKLNESDVSAFKKRALMDLALVMIPYAEEENVKKLFEISKLEIKSKDRTSQKKGYRMLEEICSGKSLECQRFIKSRLDQIKNLIIKSIAAASPSSKAPRLRCISHILSYLKPDETFFQAITPEVILCVKEEGEKTRQIAFAVLVEIGNTLLAHNENGESVAMQDFFKFILAGFAGSPLMISATILGLTRVIYEFKDKLSSNLLELVLFNVSQLMQSQVREITVASLAFIKVIVVCIPQESLAQHVEAIISSMLNIFHGYQRALRFKCKSIFERLIRKFGYSMVRSFVPETHHKLLLNIRKTEDRNKRHKLERRKGSSVKSDESRSFKSKKTTESFDDFLESESDPEFEDTANDKKSMRSSRSRKLPPTWLTEGDDDIMDFMDPLKVSKQISGTDPKNTTKKIKTEFKTTPDGRLVIEDSEEEDETATQSTKLVEADDLAEIFGGPSKKKMKRKFENFSDDDDVDDDRRSKYQPGGSGIHRLNKDFKKKMKFDYGQEYKAKGAGGDRKLKGKPSPYAYVPLSLQKLNKRKRAKMSGQFKGLVRGAQKGASKGSKQKNKKMKKFAN